MQVFTELLINCASLTSKNSTLLVSLLHGIFYGVVFKWRVWLCCCTPADNVLYFWLRKCVSLQEAWALITVCAVCVIPSSECTHSDFIVWILVSRPLWRSLEVHWARAVLVQLAAWWVSGSRSVTLSCIRPIFLLSIKP